MWAGRRNMCHPTSGDQTWEPLLPENTHILFPLRDCFLPIKYSLQRQQSWPLVVMCGLIFLPLVYLMFVWELLRFPAGWVHNEAPAAGSRPGLSLTVWGKVLIVCDINLGRWHPNFVLGNCQHQHPQCSHHTITQPRHWCYHHSHTQNSIQLNFHSFP